VKMNRLWTVGILVLIVVNMVTAQASKKTCWLYGTVTDELGAPLPYANIFISGSMDGSSSDVAGRFRFETRMNGKHSLVCSFIGYAPFSVDVLLVPGEEISLKIVLRQIQLKGSEVMITASTFTAADEEGVTLTALDVVRTPGAAADLFWAIKSFPGLQQVDEGAGLFVRGGDVSETLFQLDGAIINHPYKYESPTGGFFGTFSPFLLKGTFFSSGGFSARFGNALSGALSMESHDLPEQRRMGIGIGLAAESAYLAVPIISDKLGFSFSGNRSNTKMLFELNNASKNFSHYPFSCDMNFNLIYKFNKTQQVKLFLFHEKDRIGLEIDDPDYSTHFYGNTGNSLLNICYSNVLHNHFFIQYNAALNRFEQRAMLGVMNLDITDRLYQSKLLCEGEIHSNVKLTAGLELYHLLTEIYGSVPEIASDANPNALFNLVDTEFRSTRLAHFLELETFIWHGMRLTVGFRSEYESNSREYFVDPRMAVVYSLSSNSNISASWGRFHQYPEPTRFDPYEGNPRLGPMHAQHFIFGYAFQEESTIFRVEGYHKKYDDLVLDNASLNFTNDGYGHATGVDIFLKDSFGPASGWISYSWLLARRKWLDIPVLASPYFDIPHNFSAVINVDLPYNFALGLGYRFASGKPYTPDFKRYNEARVPSYQKLDLNVTYMHHFIETDMTVFYFSISNLLDRINIFDYRYSADFRRRDPVESAFGRSWYFGVQFNY